VRILLVDDHPLIADALGLAMASLDTRAEVTSAPTLESGVELARSGPAFGLVMLDLGLPGCAGVEAIARFREACPELPVVVFSGASDSASVTAALELGAMGYIPKTSSREVLINAVRLVLSGGIYVPVEALKAAVEPMQEPATRSGVGPAQLRLSPRQAQVLSLLLKGLPNKLIARKLDIAENTTKIHVSAVLHALGVTTRTQALIAAHRLGLRLDEPQP
jgi:DNA-binding NarL/FixJ family response regulator